MHLNSGFAGKRDHAILLGPRRALGGHEVSRAFTGQERIERCYCSVSDTLQTVAHMTEWIIFLMKMKAFHGWQQRAVACVVANVLVNGGWQSAFTISTQGRDQLLLKVAALFDL